MGKRLLGYFTFVKMSRVLDGSMDYCWERRDYLFEFATKASFQSCLQGRSLLTVGWRRIILWAILSPVSSASNPQYTWYPLLTNDFSQRGFGVAPEVEIASQSGWRAKKERASIADSQRIKFLVVDFLTQKQPRSFLDPGAMPRHRSWVTPLSSAPTTVFSFPSSKKTALPLMSA